jgi:hypothetical protein
MTIEETPHKRTIELLNPGPGEERMMGRKRDKEDERREVRPKKLAVAARHRSLVRARVDIALGARAEAMSNPPRTRQSCRYRHPGTALLRGLSHVQRDLIGWLTADTRSRVVGETREMGVVPLSLRNSAVSGWQCTTWTTTRCRCM